LDNTEGAFKKGQSR